MGDHSRLTQIIINLVGNAIKFTQKGRVEVTVKVASIENEDVLLEFSIQDTGIGIPQEKLDIIFERFTQAESNTAREYGGTGLGLSIAKQLVDLQGGALTVKSIVGMGSVFTFRIPYQRSNEVLSVAPVTEAKFSIESLSNLKVLLIEDNKLNINLILSLFSEFDLQVEVALNGSEGIDKLKAGNFDIVLLDIEMPVMNGYAAATFIRKELNNTIPIIAMTAHAMSGEREKCISLGMDDYVSKPINSNLLIEKMSILTTNRKKVNDREVEKSPEKVCDTRYITEMMGGKKHLIKGIMDEFLSQLPEELNAIKNAVQIKDFAMIRHLAHSMKSSVSVMSISVLIPILKELEDLGARAIDIEKITRLNDQLAVICNKAILEIEVEKCNFV
jgi:CheY-like chemotaxis protein